MAKKELNRYWQVNWFHPFEVVVTRQYGEYEGNTYGLDLDLRTNITYHTYEYGKLFTFRVLGFGVEVGMMIY